MFFLDIVHKLQLVLNLALRLNQVVSFASLVDRLILFLFKVMFWNKARKANDTICCCLLSFFCLGCRFAQ